MSVRRELAAAVLACVVGALLALFAATRVWVEQVHVQSAPLPPLHLRHTGTSEVPWLSALALVALAGAGALLAARGGLRTVLGAVVVLAGLGVLAGGGYGMASVAHVRMYWPLACVLAGLLICVAGVLAVARGRTWPAMGARYERPGPVAPLSPAEDQVQRIGPSPSDVAMWDALDRGEDPSR